MEAKQKYNKAFCEPCNEKQWQQNRQTWNIEQYRNEKPMMFLKPKGFMSPQHLMVIDP